MATLFQNNINNINDGVFRLLNKIFPIEPANPQNFTNGIGDIFQVAYESYKDWLKNNTELEIGANYLTHEQLYWMALAGARYLKYHKIVPKSHSPFDRLQFEQLHVWMKNKPGFQEAFGCNMTDEEKEQYQVFLANVTRIASTSSGRWT
jgi:hypothetical protein